MKEAVIVAAKRTAFGKFGGTLKHIEPEMLLKPLFQHFQSYYPEAMAKVDDVILGNVVGNDGNIARKSLLEAGMSKSIPGVTIDRQCGSGLDAVTTACRMIQAQAGSIYIVGGVESTSRAPWKIQRPQSVYDAPTPAFFERASFAPEGQDVSMIEAAENVAQRYNISRQAQDEYAWKSHQKTIASYEQDIISREIIPVKAKTTIFQQDESVKSRLTPALLGRLKPLLTDGTVTAGNSCMKNDGAGLALIMEKEMAVAMGIKCGMLYRDAVTTGVDPILLGIGPVPAVSQLLKRQKLNIEDISAIELNEAFSSQVLASINELHLGLDKVNQWGGAIATGHPYSASGATLVARLLNLPNWQYGIATMGIGGGMGNAVLFEKWCQ